MKHINNLFRLRKTAFLKKLSVFLLSVVFIASLCVSAFAADGAALVFETDKTSALPGDTITVTVTLAGVKDVVVEGLSFNINVSGGLTLSSSSVDCGSLFTMKNFAEDKLLFSGVFNKDEIKAESWKLLTLVFTVKDNGAGTQTVSLIENEKWSLFDVDYNDLSCDFSAASVSIKLPGEYREESDENRLPDSSTNTEENSKIEEIPPDNDAGPNESSNEIKENSTEQNNENSSDTDLNASESLIEPLTDENLISDDSSSDTKVPDEEISEPDKDIAENNQDGNKTVFELIGQREVIILGIAAVVVIVILVLVLISLLKKKKKK